MVAEKTAKNCRGPLFLPHPVCHLNTPNLNLSFKNQQHSVLLAVLYAKKVAVSETELFTD